MKDKQTLITHSPEETLRLARDLAGEVQKGEAVALQGLLGAGKTTFAKGFIARRSGVAEDTVTSPSFTLVEEYPGPLYHVDLYRVARPSDAQALPWEEMLAAEAVTLIEWPEHLPGLISHCQWVLEFSRTKKDERIIQVSHRESP